MFSFLSDFFAKKRIDCYAFIPLDACLIVRPYLLERAGIGKTGTVCMLAIPYYTKNCDLETRNVSAYSVSKDYHLFYKELFAELIPLLNEHFPQYRFAGFADHSPINEIDAAARAELGVMGKNHLLLTQKYSSYIFLGEIVTDAILPCQAHGIKVCEDCGACRAVCPMQKCGTCLSALTQKKGELSDEEKNTILCYGSAWGCDLCQEVCPHTIRARESGSLYSPIPFFKEDPIAHLTEESLSKMTDEEFAKRAFAWRGRETIARNLRLLEKKQKEESQC
ncbi:MAG: epoxyqueuosine reductase [Clostridia bacterium]|nr:epoxyqueuosine reductase [Clostridia bacterium]